MNIRIYNSSDKYLCIVAKFAYDKITIERNTVTVEKLPEVIKDLYAKEKQLDALTEEIARLLQI